MTNLPHSLVTETAYLTLHYRLTAAGQDIVSTFGGTPSTLQMGAQQLAPFLEAQLLGLAEGSRHVVELAPEAAFGLHQPELVRRVARADLLQAGDADASSGYQAGDLLEFTTAQGQRFTGMWRGQEGEDVFIDLNHPLAGHAIRFEVQIIAVL